MNITNVQEIASQMDWIKNFEKCLNNDVDILLSPMEVGLLQIHSDILYFVATIDDPKNKLEEKYEAKFVGHLQLDNNKINIFCK